MWLLLAVTAVLAACRTEPVLPPTATPPTATPATAAPAHLDASQPPSLELATALTYPDGRPLGNPRFAAAVVTTGGELRLFDDIGRMAGHLPEAGDDVAAVWVIDYDTGAWLDAADATYVGSANLVTPRGSGLLAAATPESARRLARELSGTVLALDEIAAYLATASADPLPEPSAGFEMGGLLEADR